MAPCSMAQSFIALATASATVGSSGTPCLIVFWSALKTGLGSRAFCTSSLKTLTPNRSLMCVGAEVDLVQVVLGGGDRLDRLLAGGGHARTAPGVVRRRAAGISDRRRRRTTRGRRSPPGRAVGLVGERILRL